MHRQQMVRIAAHDDIGPPGNGERQILVVLWIAAFADAFTGFDPFGREDDNVENAMSALHRDEPVEFRTEDDLPVLILDLLRQDEAVRSAAPAQQRPLSHAVRLYSRGDE